MTSKRKIDRIDIHQNKSCALVLVDTWTIIQIQIYGLNAALRIFLPITTLSINGVYNLVSILKFKNIFIHTIYIVRQFSTFQLGLNGLS